MDAHARFRSWLAEQLAAGATRTEVARRLEINPSVITKLGEQGTTRSVSLKLAVALEREAGIPVTAWLEEAA